MRCKIIIFSFLLLNTFYSYSQQDVDYMGVIKLNDTSIISYKIVFNETNGIINGYSITDLGGKHETKSFLKGFFNDKENTLTFNESGIIYTKSPVTEFDFCFIHFIGKLKKIDKKKQISGTFKGLYSDGQECINGEIHMSSIPKIYKRAKKLDRKIDRNKFVSKEKRDQVNLVKELDSLNMNIISKGENLNIFSKDKTIKIVIYDSGKVDGDIITLTVNGKVILSEFTISKEKKEINIALINPQTEVEVEAINVGSSAPNTVKIEITDSRNFIQTRSILNKGEKAKITILRD